MPDPHTTVGAVTRPIGPERGVAAVVLIDTDGSPTAQMRGYRASGRALEMLGLLQALLAATTRRTPVPVTVLAAADLVEAVHAHLATGAITIPEAMHQLTAVARNHTKATELGWTVTYQAGQVALPASHTDAFTSLVAREQGEHDRRHTRVWELPAADADWVAEHDAVVVYTDGSHMTTTGFGSWAWWVNDHDHDNGTVAAVTSAHVERLAVYRALRAHRGPILVVSDFADLVPEHAGRTQLSCHTRLLAKLRRELGRSNVRVLHVKGHDVCPGNLAVDRLAGDALARTWARLTHDPELATRLIALHQHRKAATKQLRVQANVRSQRRWEAETLRRERQRTQRAAQRALRPSVPSA